MEVVRKDARLNRDGRHLSVLRPLAIPEAEPIGHPSDRDQTHVWYLPSGTRHNYPSGGPGLLSLRIPTTDTPARIVGKPPSPVGRTSLVTSRMNSRILLMLPW